MPVYLRRYSIQRINKHLQEQKEAHDKAMEKSTPNKRY